MTITNLYSNGDEAGSAWAHRAEAALVRPVLRPHTVVALASIVISLAGWLALALMVGEMAGRVGLAQAGPGMGVFSFLEGEGGALAALGSAALIVCGNSLAAAQSLGASSMAEILPVYFLMWAAMSASMMIPSAAPMFSTYADLADTARAKGRPVVSPLVLIAGYGAVWLGFCLAASGLQLAAAKGLMLSDAQRLSRSGLSAGVLALAGLYQFSSLKTACLVKCRMPFSFFFANWTVRPAGVFMLGVRQGGYCLGCCWALMLVMFATGVMNIVWMAILALVMILEKVAPHAGIVRYGAGMVLLAWAAGLAVISF